MDSVLELVLDQGEEWKNKRSEEWKMNVKHVKRDEKSVITADTDEYLSFVY